MLSQFFVCWSLWKLKFALSKQKWRIQASLYSLKVLHSSFEISFWIMFINITFFNYYALYQPISANIGIKCTHCYYFSFKITFWKQLSSRITVLFTRSMIGHATLQTIVGILISLICKCQILWKTISGHTLSKTFAVIVAIIGVIVTCKHERIIITTKTDTLFNSLCLGYTILIFSIRTKSIRSLTIFSCNSTASTIIKFISNLRLTLFIRIN